jgi:hypothetical protein
MSQYLEHHQFYNKPILLSEEFRKSPLTFLERFFSDYHLCDLREMLENMLETCLTTDNPPFNDPENRADIILFCKNVVCLFETAFLLKDSKS